MSIWFELTRTAGMECDLHPTDITAWQAEKFQVNGVYDTPNPGYGCGDGRPHVQWGTRADAIDLGYLLDTDVLRDFIPPETLGSWATRLDHLHSYLHADATEQVDEYVRLFRWLSARGIGLHCEA